MKIERVTTDEGFAQLADAWNRLHQVQQQASVFMSFDVAYSWWMSFKVMQQDVSLCLLVLRDDSGTIRCIFPLYKRLKKRLWMHYILASLLVTNKDGKNLDVLCEPGYETACADAFFAHAQDTKDTPIYVFLFVLPQSFIHTYLAKGSKRTALHIQERAGGYYEVALKDSWEDVLNRLRPRMRTHVRKALRAFEAKKYQYVPATDTKTFVAAVSSLVELHQSRWQDEGQEGAFGGLGIYRRSFIEKLYGQKSDALQIYSLYDGAEPIGHQLYYHEDGRVYLMQEGYATTYREDDPGTMLRALVFQDLLSRGGYTYDFMTGDTFNKRSWGGTFMKQHYVYMARSTFINTLYFVLDPLIRFIKGKVQGFKARYV